LGGKFFELVLGYHDRWDRVEEEEGFFVDRVAVLLERIRKGRNSFGK